MQLTEVVGEKGVEGKEEEEGGEEEKGGEKATGGTRTKNKAALLAKDLTGSRNSVVVVYIVAVRYYDYIMIYFFCSWCSG